MNSHQGKCVRYDIDGQTGVVFRYKGTDAFKYENAKCTINGVIYGGKKRAGYRAKHAKLKDIGNEIEVIKLCLINGFGGYVLEKKEKHTLVHFRNRSPNELKNKNNFQLIPRATLCIVICH